LAFQMIDDSFGESVKIAQLVLKYFVNFVVIDFYVLVDYQIAKTCHTQQAREQSSRDNPGPCEGLENLFIGLWKWEAFRGNEVSSYIQATFDGDVQATLYCATQS